MRKLAKYIAFLQLAAGFLTSCQEIPAMDEVEGVYKFSYLSGEVEVLMIRGDSTYTKDIFASDSAFQNNVPAKYSNGGSWSISETGELTFRNWLMYNRLLNPNEILATPFNVMMTGGSWEKNSQGDEELYLFEDTGYVFKKVE